MSHNEAALYHSNGYNAQAACEHCEGIIRHERWCQTFKQILRLAITAARMGERHADEETI
jgi:hypothetical protein